MKASISTTRALKGFLEYEIEKLADDTGELEYVELGVPEEERTVKVRRATLPEDARREVVWDFEEEIKALEKEGGEGTGAAR